MEFFKDLDGLDILVKLLFRERMMNKKIGLMLGTLFALGSAQNALAACADIPRNLLVSTGIAAAEAAGAATGGYGLKMWATVVDESGKVCEIATSGTAGANAGNSEWLGSRVISAQKANTANAFSLNGYAISTANLYSAVQPGGSLYGLQHSNPVDASRAYQGNPISYGQANDWLKNNRIGGVNVFGGGLALYKNGKKVGALGVSGDTSCRDHAYAWTMRQAMGMEPGGVGITTYNANVDGSSAVAALGTVGDEMVFANASSTAYWNAWSHPMCPNTEKGVWSVDAPATPVFVLP
jgi:uncharacterized protein GlcG (DUF336 family)